jgi:hypothetical protein
MINNDTREVKKHRHKIIDTDIQEAINIQKLLMIFNDTQKSVNIPLKTKISNET